MSLQVTRFDVAVRWDDGTISNPIMIAEVDDRTGEILTYQIKRVANDASPGPMPTDGGGQ